MRFARLHFVGALMRRLDREDIEFAVDDVGIGRLVHGEGCDSRGEGERKYDARLG